jgi:hypothetical protein
MARKEGRTRREADLNFKRQIDKELSQQVNDGTLTPAMGDASARKAGLID